MDFMPRVNEDNPDPRIACAILLDTSFSMDGEPIEQLNKGFALFCDEIKNDELAQKRAEVIVITFGGSANVAIPFTEGRDLQPRRFTASGATPLGSALNVALDQLDSQKAAYRQSGLEYYRPWLFVITDGAPTDGAVFDNAAERVRRVEAAKGVSVFGIGVGQAADLDKLSRISAQRQPMPLSSTNFSEFFKWLSASLSVVSASQGHGPNDAGADRNAANEQVALPGVSGWAHP